jgi:hypothetical protein
LLLCYMMRNLVPLILHKNAPFLIHLGSSFLNQEQNELTGRQSPSRVQIKEILQREILHTKDADFLPGRVHIRS